jgi:hypothetical protein
MCTTWTREYPWNGIHSLEYLQFRQKQMMDCPDEDVLLVNRARICISTLIAFVRHFPSNGSVGNSLACNLETLIDLVDEADVRGDTLGYVHDLLQSDCTLLADASLVDKLIQKHLYYYQSKFRSEKENSKLVFLPWYQDVNDNCMEEEESANSVISVMPFSVDACDIVLHHCPCNDATAVSAKTLIKAFWKSNRNTSSVELKNAADILFEREFDPALLECIEQHAIKSTPQV